MADKKISQLTAATVPLAGTEVLPVVQGGSTVKVAVSDLTAGRNTAVAGLTATPSGAYQSVGIGAGSTYGIISFNGAFGVNSSIGIAGGANGDNATYLLSPSNIYGRIGSSNITNTSSTGFTVVGDIYATGNFVVGTAGKGITTGGSIALNFGTNSTVTQMALYPSGQLALNTATLSTGFFTIDTTALPGIDLFRSDSSANYEAVRFRDTTNANTYGSLGWDSSGLRLNGNAGTLYLSSSGNERLIVKPNGQVRFIPLAAAPSGAETGDVYYDSGTNKLYCYNGSGWQALF